MEVLDDFYNIIFCQITPTYPDPYSFDFNPSHKIDNTQQFQSNLIKTTKYNAVNFFPKAILNQYKRIANFYFLAVAIMSTIPGVTPFSPALIWLPLGVVLLVSLIKQAYQDYQRGKIDKQINQMSKTTVLRGNQIVQMPWSDIVVGDICLIKEDQAFPADLLLLSTTKKDGIAYIQTATLDGQKTSKLRYAFESLTTNLIKAQDFHNLKGTFNGEIPNQSLDYFRAALSINQLRFQINDNKQLLYRGAKLKNTQQIWGLAIYTGQCSKIMMNSQISLSKITVVEKRLNVLLVSMFVCQIILCVVMSMLSIRQQTNLYGNATYLSWGNYHPSAKKFIRNFMMFFIDYSSIIPISLIVSMQIVKLAQSYFIDFDKLMYSKKKNQGAVARNAALNEQLGQISYVFTDKTGTLTTNAMTFKNASIGDQVYQFNIDTDKNYISNHFNLDFNDKEKRLKRAVNLTSGDGQVSQTIEEQQDLIHNYLLALLCCNTVNTVKKAGENVYESESPDQIALIKFTKSLGYDLIKRENSNIQVMIKGKPSTIKILQKFSFTSERKRMSVLVQIDGKIMLFLKGADNIVSQRIQSHWFKVPKAVEEMSRRGLRTLMVAIKLVSYKQYLHYNKAMHETSLQQRQQVIDRYASIFESNLELIGATALLDQLQEGVPQTLRDLQRAHINVWVLTGDKLQTAIQVSKSCCLIEPNYKIIECRADTRSCIQSQMDQWFKTVSQNTNIKYSLVIQGSRLGQIFQQKQISKQFALMSLNFASVICCRLLPIQKAQTVKLIRSHLNKVCLAIGDGGNDVSMLKQAHIGIGLYGEEGMSAVQASDYAIPEFRMLWRLMFVHGRWNYIRVSEMILYFTYKSLLFTIPRVVFATFTGYSGQPIFDDYYIALYNILFTSLPLLVRALFQQDVNYVLKKNKVVKDQREKQPALQRQDSISQQNMDQIWNESEFLPKGFTIDWQVRNLLPRIYFLGKDNQILNLTSCICWITQAVILGLITAVLSISIVSRLPISPGGHQADLWMVSITIYTVVILLNNIKIAMHVRHWTGLFLFSVIGCSLAPYLIYVWISNYTLSKYVHGTVIMSFRNPTTYLVVTLITIVCIIIVSLVIYITFHTNKMAKKLRLKMLRQKHTSETLSQTNGDDMMRNEQLVVEPGVQKLIKIKINIATKQQKQSNQIL